MVVLLVRKYQRWVCHSLVTHSRDSSQTTDDWCAIVNHLIE
jgi:hypothetical protein